MGLLAIPLLLYAADAVLDEAASACRLTRRAAYALAAMDSKGTVASNESLRDILLRSKLSSEKSVAKEASEVKSDLLKANYLKIEGKVSVFSVTPEGHQIAQQFREAIASAIQSVDMPKRLRRLLQEIFRPARPTQGSPETNVLPDALPLPKKQVAAIPRASKEAHPLVKAI